jgi:uncharacterized protein
MQKQLKSTLEFENFLFVKHEEGVKVIFMRYFYFYVSDKELREIGDYDFKKNTISFDCKESLASRKFMNLVMGKLAKELKFRNGTDTVFITSGPLIGGRRFGIIDSDTNCIEIRPITGCNLACIYCSVDEGIKVRKTNYLIDRGLMVRELGKLTRRKKSKELYIHISSQGEPLMYTDMVELVREISRFPKVKHINIGSNGTYLTPKFIDELVEAGLTRFNLSINAMDPEKAKEIAGCDYNIERVKEIARYLNTKLELIIAPTLLSGINDDEIPKIITFCKELGCHCGIQNFLFYKGGRNIENALAWEQFAPLMKKWEDEFDIKLLPPDIEFKIVEDKILGKPFKKGDVVVGDYRFPEYVQAKNRLIHVPSMKSYPGRSKIKVKLIKDKHNNFIGVTA